MIPGTNVTLGNKKYLVPPLNVAAMMLHRAFIKKMMSGEVDPDSFLQDGGDLDTMLELFHLAVKRNYPDVTVEELSEHIDMSNFQAIFGAMMKISGFEVAEKPAGE